MPVRRGILWTDAGSRTALTFLRASVTGAAIETQLSALSNCSPQVDWEGTESLHVPTPLAQVFADVADVAYLYWQDAAGTSVARVTLPGPKANIFFPDNQTVNPANIAALNTAVLANLLTPAGTLAATFLSGQRKRLRDDMP